MGVRVGTAAGEGAGAGARETMVGVDEPLLPIPERDVPHSSHFCAEGGLRKGHSLQDQCAPGARAPAGEGAGAGAGAGAGVRTGAGAGAGVRTGAGAGARDETLLLERVVPQSSHFCAEGGLRNGHSLQGQCTPGVRAVAAAGAGAGERVAGGAGAGAGVRVRVGAGEGAGAGAGAGGDTPPRGVLHSSHARASAGFTRVHAPHGHDPEGCADCAAPHTHSRMLAALMCVHTAQCQSGSERREGREHRSPCTCAVIALRAGRSLAPHAVIRRMRGRKPPGYPAARMSPTVSSSNAHTADASYVTHGPPEYAAG